MSTLQETVLLSMKADFSDLIKESAELKDQSQQLTVQIKLQREELAKLEKQGKGNTESYKQLNEELVANEQSVKALNKQQSVINKSIQDGVQFNLAQKNSIVGLRAEYNRMKDVYINLSEAERDNKAVGGEMLKQLSEKSEKLKALETAYGDNRRNVGNYKDTIRDLTAEFRIGGISIGQFITGFSKVKDVVKSSGTQLNSFNGILKANAIGVVITLVAGLIAVFTKFQPVVDKVEQAFSGINAVVDVLVGRLIQIGQGLLNIIQGNFTEGINQIRTSFDNLGSSIEGAYNEGVKWSKLQQEIDDKNRENIISNSRLNKEIDQLLLKAKNRTLSEKERLSLLDQASAKERQAFENTRKAAQMELDLAQGKYDQAVKNQTLNDEIEDARANAIAKLNNLESDSINLQEKIANRRDALIQEQEAERQKVLERKIKAEKELAEAYKFYSDLSEKMKAEALQKEISELEASTKVKIGLSEDEANQILAIRKLSSEEMAKIALMTKDQQIKYIEEIKNKELSAQKVKVDAALGAATSIIGALGSISEMAGDNAEFGKQLAIAQAVIDTFSGATKAFAQGGPLGFFTGAAVIAAGMANVAKISSTPIPVNKAAGGGDFLTTGPTTLIVGDNPGGVERVTVEPLSGYGTTHISPQSNLVAMAGGGRLTSDGGYSRRNNSQNSFNYEELAKAFSKTNIIITASEINKVNDLSKTLANVSDIN